jgi:hypothetical protein
LQLALHCTACVILPRMNGRIFAALLSGLIVFALVYEGGRSFLKRQVEARYLDSLDHDLKAAISGGVGMSYSNASLKARRVEEAEESEHLSLYVGLGLGLITAWSIAATGKKQEEVQPQ